MNSPDVSLFDLAAAIGSQDTPEAPVQYNSIHTDDQKEEKSLIIKAYHEACNRHDASSPFPDHVTILKQLQSLGLFARWHWNKMPPHGQAIIDISPISGHCPTNEQLAAMLDTLLHLNHISTPTSEEKRAVLVHHLDLSGLFLSDTHIHLIRTAPSTTCHYSTIASLHLNKCGLSFTAFNNLLLHSESVALLETLERLDISNNPNIGLSDNDNDTISSCRKASDFWRISRLWRCSKLKYVDLSWTNLSCEALCYIVDYLIRYQALSEDNSTLPGGARCHLECIKMGPPSPDTDTMMNEAMIEKLKEMMAVLPKLQVVEVFGVNEEQQNILRMEWNRIKNNNSALGSDDDDEVEVEDEGGPTHTHVRLALTTTGEMCAAEIPPTDHIPPPPETPSNGSRQEVVEVNKQQSVLPPPPFSADLMAAGTTTTTVVAPRRDQQLAVAQELRQVKPTQYQQQRLMPPRPSNRNNNRARGRDDDGDEFVGGGGEVDLETSSQEPYEDDNEDEEEDEVIDHRGHRVAAVMDDDEFDDDDKAGRAFKKKAKELCDKIKMVNIEDGKLADNCYRIWNRFALNAWDRRRWSNPSRDQNDLPETVNKLCLLLDLFREYGYVFFPGNFKPPPSYRAGVALDGFRKTMQEEEDDDEEREEVPPVLKRIRTNEQDIPKQPKQGGVAVFKRKAAVIDEDDDDE